MIDFISKNKLRSSILLVVIISLFVIGFFYPDNHLEEVVEKMFFYETGAVIDISHEAENFPDELDEMEIRDVDGKIKLMWKKGSQLSEHTNN